MLHESTLMLLEDPAKVPRIPVEKKRITSSCSKMIKGTSPSEELLNATWLSQQTDAPLVKHISFIVSATTSSSDNSASVLLHDLAVSPEEIETAAGPDTLILSIPPVPLHCLWQLCIL
ncbi:unnamed protein product [Caretta caretta]